MARAHGVERDIRYRQQVKSAHWSTAGACWTLKSDLTAMYVCRLLNRMDRTGMRQCTPPRSDPAMAEETALDFTSGYVQRGIGRFPKQGSRAPWKPYQNYLRDLLSLRFGRIDDGEMQFGNPAEPPRE